MQRILYVLILFALTAQCALAQQRAITTVHLKNGSVVKGKVFRSKTSDRIKAETPDGSIVMFTENAIKEIVKETYTPSSMQEAESTVYLQNGSIINGKVTKSRDGSRMKVDTPSGSVVYFTERTVKEITAFGDDAGFEDFAATTPRQRTQTQAQRDPGRQTTAQQPAPAAYEEAPKQSGYRGILEAGYTMKMGEISTSRIEITTSHGYQMNNRLFIGVGLGANLYNGDGLYYKGVSPWANEKGSTLDSMNVSITIPVFVDFRVDFLDKGSVRPFAGVKAGYTMGFQASELSTVNDGKTYNKKETKLAGIGIYAQPSVGVKFMVGNSAAVNLSVGYAIQTFEHYYVIDGTQYKKQKNNGGVNIRVGFEF